MSSKFLNLSTDKTLGGDNPSDEIVSSQKAIKEYVDDNAGPSYSAGTGIVISQSDEISVDGENIGNVADTEPTEEVNSEEISEKTLQELLSTISGYDSTSTQTLKHINGTLTWVTE